MADNDHDDDSGGRSKRPRTSPEGIDPAEHRLRVIEFTHAEIFGADGDGGAFKALTRTVKRLEAEVQTLRDFRIKTINTIAIGTMLGSAIAGLVVFLIEHYAGK